MAKLQNLNYPGDDKIDAARLKVLAMQIVLLNQEIKARDPRDDKKQAAKAKGLIAAVKQLIKDASSNDDYIKSRLGAIKQVYEIYSKTYAVVDKMDAPTKKRLVNPSSVKISGDMKSKLKGSRKAELESGYDHLLKEMKKPKNYVQQQVDGVFSPTYNKHEAHVSGKGNSWKAYIEEGTKNSKWRLYFVMSFDEAKEELTVKLAKAVEDH
ncbi:MAG: hypothetical protein WD046_01345 [Paracoccaceae bacterium]